MNHKKIILITIIVLILIGLTVGFYYWFQYERSKTSEGSDESEILKEISQEEAVEIALERYPGEVNSVNKTEAPLFVGSQDSSEDNQDSAENFWVVEINLDEPVEKELPAGSFSTKAEVFIDIHAGSISVVGFK